MKLERLKSKLEDEFLQMGYKKEKTIRKEFEEKKQIKAILSRKNKLNELKIIGITGSRGKSSVAYIVHQYLKLLGYKSILYSSAMIDSPASFICKDEACEVSFHSNEELLAIIEEAEAYEADYLVLEINESTLQKGLAKDIPFTIRALTNLNPKHNLEQYEEEEYIALKKSFFENISDECKCVIGLQDYSKELFENILSLNAYPKVTFSSKYIAKTNHIDQEKITCLLENLNHTLNGLDIDIRIKNQIVHLHTTMMMNYNGMNIVCSLAILEALGILEPEKFNTCIQYIKIPGRTEMQYVNGRLIVVDVHLPMMLEGLNSLKNKGEIKKIKVVVGAIGYGYKTWDDKFNFGKHFETRHESRKYAMELLKQYADKVYLTENDNAAEDVMEICQELQGYLKQVVPSKIITDREEAISKAIKESDVGDVIFISGRGNRRILCDTETTMKLVKDSEVVEKVLEELGW